MGFKDYITNWKYRREAGKRLERFHNLKPPDNPSPRHIRKLVRRLLDPDRSDFALKELGMIGAAAVPALWEALEDDRFARRTKPERFSHIDPLNAVVGLLARHEPDSLLAFLEKLVDSGVHDAQKISGTHAAGTGLVRALPIVKRCLEHENGYVRCGVLHGVQTAIERGRIEPGFQDAMYELLLAQCDQQWPISGNDSPRVLILLDRDRAETDLARPGLLSSDNPNLRDLLTACRVADLPLQPAPIEAIYRDALRQVHASEGRAYPHDSIAAEALLLLAGIAPPSDVMTCIRKAVSQDNERLQEAAAHASAKLSGVEDAAGFAVSRREEIGYSGLTDAQRVVYCAFLFDAEVCNGGLMQFFGNSSGDHARDTLEALERLEQPEAVHALKKAMEAIGPAAEVQDREARLRAFRGRYESLQDVFGPLEGGYWKKSAGLRASLNLFAAKHAADFR